MVSSGVTVNDECVKVADELRFGKSGLKDIIFKINDAKTEIIVDQSSKDNDHDAFIQNLTSCKDESGNPSPRYALRDVEFELPGEGRRKKTVFISFVPEGASTKWSMVYATSRQLLQSTLNAQCSMHADDKADLEWKAVAQVANNNKPIE
ncbi:hypothetical protein FQN57_003339 [Myotisia sp. PD_48]|nr:hypothetical protein FQN57_003339 [Myotisia sp. PD_48]